MKAMRVKITVHVPEQNADELCKAIGDTGAGTIGDYTHCSFTYKGVGRFTPTEQADPHIGSSGKEEKVDEVSIEVICDKSQAKKVINAIKKSHPYEEPAYEIIQLIDESEL